MTTLVALPIPLGRSPLGRGPLGWSPGVPTPAVVAPAPPWLSARDRTILADARARLDATGRFEAVAATSPGADPHEAATDRPLALVAPLSATEADQWADLWLRTLKFAVTLVARDEEQLGRHDALDALGDAAIRSIQNRSLAGATLPALTRAANQQYGPVDHPDQSLMITFDAAYFVDPESGHDEIPDPT